MPKKEKDQSRASNSDGELDLPRMTTDRSLEDFTEADQELHAMLAHAIQTGVGFCLEHNISKECTPKSLRTGLNIAMCSHAALVRLLIHKGAFTGEEYAAVLSLEMAREKDDYETRISIATGKNVSLG